MDFITAEKKNDTLIIKTSGRIDSNNAAEADAVCSKYIEENGCGNIIIDVDNLEYISSAGLRVILHIRKANPNVRIINASSDVYEIFEMTGFSEMISVEKAYRKLSIDGCEVIGEGANGKVYRLDPDTIIKVYMNPDSLSDIERERALARRAFVLGVPTAIPYDIVRVDGSYGSVFELLDAKSLAKLLREEPERIDEWVKESVDLLKIIHSTEVNPSDMPDMKAVSTGWINFLKEYLDTEKWKKLKTMIENVPENHHMIHGDYHIKNVMMQKGEALLIDMDTLAFGDPIFEFASIYNAYKGFSDHIVNLDRTSSDTFLGISREISEQFWDKSVRMYFNTDDEEEITVIENKAKLMGYCRLMRRLIRRNGLMEDKETVGFYKENIEKLTDKVDKLTF